MPSGTSILDFGPFPGKSDAEVIVTGQSEILASSLVEAWIMPSDTQDHSADEHMVESIKVFAGNIVPGSGFTIYGFNTSEINEPVSPPKGIVGGGGLRGGLGTRIYGKFMIAWAWN